ncbi:MAG: hypothetical protein IJQ95_00450, partial [Paludibacteraceae bacterium]|nr:hypothetical protein [Paludibacteraceae bacterium]
MRKFLSILGALLMCAMMWAAPTSVTYTVASTSAVEKSGTAPDGATATYASTYTTKCQLTKNNSMTLTLSGFEGYKITGITLSMKSNKSAGSGSFTAVAGTTTISSIATAAFSDATWNGAYTQTYTDVTPAMTDDDYEIQEDEDVVLTIAATVNSLFCESFTIEYEEVAAATTTLYCKMEQSWWTTDGAAVGVHYWGGATSTTWPGVRMTAVDGESGLWTYDVPSDATGIIFTRVNGSGVIADWGAKTGDLTIPTDGNNMYTITSASAVWGDPGCTGTWSKYTPAAPKYYVTGNAALVGAAKAWDATAIEMTDGSYTFANLAAGEYVLKVTKNGSTWYGYEALNVAASSANIYDGGDPDHNIEFEVETPNNVTVAFDGSKITLTGTFVERTTTFTVTVPDETPKCYIAGNFTGWAQVAMTAAGANKFTYVMSGNPTDTASYKYCAGAAWKYTEVNADRSEKANRSYAANDIVADWAQVPGATLADTYTSNVTLATTGGTSASVADIVVLGDTVKGLKAGTGSVTGAVKVTIPAGVANLHFHAYSWNTETVTLSISGLAEGTKAVAIAKNTGVAGNSPYTMAGDPEQDGYYKIAVNTTEETTLTFTATGGKRFVLFGVNTEGTYVPPVLETLNLIPGVWSEANAKFAAWTWGEDLAGAWTAFFAGTGDTLTAAINAEADSI